MSYPKDVNTDDCGKIRQSVHNAFKSFLKLEIKRRQNNLLNTPEHNKERPIFTGAK